MARSNLKIVKLRKGKVPDDTTFIETLVWMLDQARKGEVLGYAMVFTVDEDGGTKIIEGACVQDGRHMQGDAMRLLGAIRLMEKNFIERNWPNG